MSNAVTPLGGAKTNIGGLTLEDMGLQGMISLRGDLSSKALAKAVKAVTGQGVPELRTANVAGGKGAAWMSPDELLLFVPYAEAESAVATISETMKAEHHLAVNVSDARGFMRLSGAGAHEVMSKNAPVDFHKDVFTAGMFRRSRLGQVAAAFWLDAEGGFNVVCFRSVADYVYRLLEVSAEAGAVDAL
ncbi:sarcosine oxidase subunit gamma family protein [Marivivens sp. LCG002]|uniref:sarcosine oxidase subunit gamma n=1 Tax=Marivivens sp. LCG002 TaxID=3051171 RepID=UPI002552C8DC|nr:sarcosine oxidase subunit gamma family protein [Marivivens sp. LCG002]WIV49581.1 sarcosine oxidase subunit gamma family protein [Marivivens sp. LCG002]